MGKKNLKYPEYLIYYTYLLRYFCYFACVFSDILWFSPPSARSKGKGELSLQAVQGTDTAQTDPNSRPKKRKMFDKMELAAMDTIYKASKGLPTSSMIERLTSSLGLEKDQVF